MLTRKLHTAIRRTSLGVYSNASNESLFRDTLTSLISPIGVVKLSNFESYFLYQLGRWAPVRV